MQHVMCAECHCYIRRHYPKRFSPFLMGGAINRGQRNQFVVLSKAEVHSAFELACYQRATPCCVLHPLSCLRVEMPNSVIQILDDIEALNAAAAAARKKALLLTKKGSSAAAPKAPPRKTRIVKTAHNCSSMG